MTATNSQRWRYHAADSTGVDVAGEIDAASERDAVDALRRRALWVTSLEPMRMEARLDVPKDGAFHETTRPMSTARAWLARLTGDSVASELAVITRAMSTLLAAGVPLDRALAYAAGPSSRPELQRAFSAVRDGVRKGESLSGAMSREPVFPALFGPTLSAGEASGTLDTSLETIADHLDRAEAMRARLRAALAYPALLGVASIGGVVVILLMVVPRFATLIADSGGTLPFSTRMLIAVSGVVTRGWWLIVAVLFLAVFLVRRWLANGANRTRWHRARLGWPIVGQFERTRAAASYTGVLAVALRAGVSLLQAMRLARGVVRNVQIAGQLAEAEERVRSGGSLARALDGILPPLSVRLLDAGEAGGNLSAMAARASQTADVELQRAASGAVALVEPALILVFGAVVGFVALALLQAIYGLNARTL